MAKKFDTNPLDPDFPETVRETQKEAEVQITDLRNSNGGKTRKFAEPFKAEEKTRKFSETEFDSFQSDNGANSPADYQPRAIYAGSDEDDKKTHNIGSISLPENVLTALPYIPFAFIGVIAGILELVFIPKSEPKIRYHAAQGLAAHLGIFLILQILRSTGWIIGGIGTIASVFSIITTIMLLVFTVKAWQGKPIHIEAVQDLTDWIEDKIKPQQ